jgi:hypothetical protein
LLETSLDISYQYDVGGTKKYDHLLSIDRNNKNKNTNVQNLKTDRQKSANSDSFKKRNNLVIYEDAKNQVSGQKLYGGHKLNHSASEENKIKNNIGTYGSTKSKNTKKVRFGTETEIIPYVSEFFKNRHKINGSTTNSIVSIQNRDDVDGCDEEYAIVKTNDEKKDMTDVKDMNNSMDCTSVSKGYDKDITWADIVRRSQQTTTAH